MIIYPKDWSKNYEDLACKGDHTKKVDIINIIETLKNVISTINVRHIAYSGGIDSTILLCLMSKIFDEVHTYSIASRKEQKDLHFSRLGSKMYNSNHHEFVVKPTITEADKFLGDNAVRQLFEEVSKFTDKIICGDGIDEFMCGYYKHMDLTFDTYLYFLSKLLPNHLIPLNKGSANVKVYLPYLDGSVVSIVKNILLEHKVDTTTRKKIMVSVAKYLNINDDIIHRNKYGFVDAFIEKDK